MVLLDHISFQRMFLAVAAHQLPPLQCPRRGTGVSNQVLKVTLDVQKEALSSAGTSLDSEGEL